MIEIGRRVFLAGLAAASAAPNALRAQEALVDGAGRRVPVPFRVERVFPAGPPAAILLYTLAPDLLLGWPRADRPEERAYLRPDIAARPELGRLTGRGNTANLEVVLQLKPDLILDIGSMSATYVSLADRVQAQTGIPYALLDGRLEATPATYRLLGRFVGQETRAAELAACAESTLRDVQRRVEGVDHDRRPRTYYARGPRGLETGLAGSINVESIELMGARNVAGAQRGGLATVSLEQVLAWDPDDPALARHDRRGRYARDGGERRGRRHRRLGGAGRAASRALPRGSKLPASPAHGRAAWRRLPAAH